MVYFSSLLKAVTNKIEMSFVLEFSFNNLATSKPSISGICTSNNIKATSHSKAIFKASFPELAESIFLLSSSNKEVSEIKFSGLSSTIKIFITIFFLIDSNKNKLEIDSCFNIKMCLVRQYTS